MYSNSYNVGQGLAPAEKDGTSKPVPYKLWNIKETYTNSVMISVVGTDVLATLSKSLVLSIQFAMQIVDPDGLTYKESR